jgi:crotonobetainyl-CoA:carnitine CoA-transferase CaiB-like acyl-CoA transferase
LRRRISLVARATSLGADVIKVEATEGEVGRRVGPFITGEGSRVSFLHATVNRNKRSLTLDLRSPAGRVAFLKLAARSDIVVQNFRPMAARHQHRDQTDATVAAWMKMQSAADVEREFAKAGIPAAAVRTYAEAAANPHVIERDMLHPIEQEDGNTVPLTGPAVRFSRTPIWIRTRAARG